MSKSVQLDCTFFKFGKTINVCSKGLDTLEENNNYVFEINRPFKFNLHPIFSFERMGAFAALKVIG